MLKSINPKNIKVYDILAKTPSDTRIKIREQRTKGSPDIVYFNDTVDSFFNCREVSLKIAEKLSVLKLVIEVSNPKIQT